MQREETPPLLSLGSLLDTPYEGLYIIDSEWRYTYVNSKAAQLVNRPIEALLGQNIWQLFPEAIDTVIYTHAYRAVEQHLPQYFEAYYPPLATWFESRLYPTSEGLVVLSRDITTRKRMEQQQHRQTALLDHIAEPILIWKFRGPILYWNKGAELLYGFTKEEAIGRNIHDLLCTQHFEPLQQIYETLLQTDTWQGELIHTAKDGSQHVVECIKSLFREDDGSLFIMETNRDVTERRALDQLKDEFISMASHELKIPITVLKGFMHLMRVQVMQQGGQEAEHTLNRMETQITRSTKLIDDLLDVSKMQAGHINLTVEPVDIDALVRETIEELLSLYSTHHFEVTGTTHAIILGDRDRLRQVLINLMTNAVKYAPGSSKVEIKLVTSKKNATISIHDQGVGIPLAHQEHIFDRYYRIPGATGHNIPGLGIGLYIAHEIIIGHGGTIAVESGEGQGATFTISLPLQKE